MSDSDANSREELPIERGFPIEQVNDLADREGRAKLY
jgi:putative DNA methylase